jgi:hypothetical protein
LKFPFPYPGRLYKIHSSVTLNISWNGTRARILNLCWILLDYLQNLRLLGPVWAAAWEGIWRDFIWHDMS